MALPGFESYVVETVGGSTTKTVFGTAIVPRGVNLVCFNAVGTIIVRPSDQGRLLIIPPKSATYVMGPVRLALQAARGEHEIEMISWPGALAPLLESWAASQIALRQGARNPSIACKPIRPCITGAYERFSEFLKDSDSPEPLVIGVLHEIVPELLRGSDEFLLATVPDDMPETILSLAKSVREDPSHPWPLKEAADAAGYSPFHFSRVFKALVGYGFHEYVDRRRTEVAIDLLCNTDKPVDLVASTAGFGTTQGLRESVKEYLGLVPSELRISETVGT